MTPVNRPYDEIKKDLEEALKWIEEQLGKTFNANSRAMKYLSDIEQISNQWNIDGGDSLIKSRTLPAVLNSMTQGDSIGLVVKSLRTYCQVAPDLLGKMFNSLQGPE